MLCVIVHDAFAHHGARSGYVQLIPHLRSYADVRVIRLDRNAAGRYKTLSEWWKSARAQRFARRQLHLYSEQTLFPGLLPAQTVAVCHQPISAYTCEGPRATLLRFGLRRSKMLIGLGPEQSASLKCLNSRVTCVPHGVDTEWFTPGKASTSPVYVAVGGWLRDDDAQSALVARASRAGHVVAVGRPGAPRLTDKEYRDVLQTSTAMLLSIPDGVASNAVIEAASCGLAIIGNLSKDLHTYISPENRRLLSLSIDSQFELAMNELRVIGEANRAWVAPAFSWPAITRQLVGATLSAFGEDSDIPA